jgi:hypothetical protein
MPSVSKAQQGAMGAALGGSNNPVAKKIRASMTTKQIKEFASTKHKGLPERKHPLHEFRHNKGVN